MDRRSYRCARHDAANLRLRDPSMESSPSQWNTAKTFHNMVFYSGGPLLLRLRPSRRSLIWLIASAEVAVNMTVAVGNGDAHAKHSRWGNGVPNLPAPPGRRRPGRGPKQYCYIQIMATGMPLHPAVSGGNHVPGGNRRWIRGDCDPMAKGAAAIDALVYTRQGRRCRSPPRPAATSGPGEPVRPRG